jgi:hypothetical protein
VYSGFARWARTPRQSTAIVKDLRFALAVREGIRWLWASGQRSTIMSANTLIYIQLPALCERTCCVIFSSNSPTIHRLAQQEISHDNSTAQPARSCPRREVMSYVLAQQRDGHVVTAFDNYRIYLQANRNTFPPSAYSLAKQPPGLDPRPAES